MLSLSDKGQSKVPLLWGLHLVEEGWPTIEQIVALGVLQNSFAHLWKIKVSVTPHLLTMMV